MPLSNQASIHLKNNQPNVNANTNTNTNTNTHTNSYQWSNLANIASISMNKPLDAQQCLT